MTTLALLLMIGATPAGVAIEATPEMESRRAPRFRVIALDGAARIGEVIEWIGDGPLRIKETDGAIRAVESADLVRLSREIETPSATSPSAFEPIGPATSAPTVERWEFQTRGGERLIGSVSEGDETGFRVRRGDGSHVHVPLEQIERLTRYGQDQTANAPSNDAAPDEDLISLRNGDRAAGLIDRIEPEGISLQTGERRRVLKWSVVAAARLAVAESPATGETEEASRRFICMLSGGEILKAVSIDWRGPTLLMRHEGNETLRLDSASLLSVEASGGRWQWLDDLPTDSYESIPFLDRTWTLQRGRNAAGGPLRCSGETVARGIGLHSAARIGWKLDRRYERLVGRIGIDDSGGPWSDAHVEFRVDGRSLARMEHLRCGEPTRPMDLRVAEGNLLEIVVEFGDHGDLQDRVNLLDAALIRPDAKRLPR